MRVEERSSMPENGARVEHRVHVTDPWLPETAVAPGWDPLAAPPPAAAVAPAWLLTVAVDVVFLLPSAFWFPSYFRGLTTTAVLVLALFAAGGLYRPRLHLSLLDDLPRLIGRLLIAT